MSPILARSGRLAAILLPVVAMVVWTSSGEARTEHRFPAAVTPEGVKLWAVEPGMPSSQRRDRRVSTGPLHFVEGGAPRPAGSSAIGPRGIAALEFDKTVGTDPGVCASSSVIEVGAPSEVTYCYAVENTGSTTLSEHDLVDDQLGTILNDFPGNVEPGWIVWITQSAVIDTRTVNVAVWSAGGTFDIDSATVEVFPGLMLHKTVGLDPAACATTTVVDVPPGTQVTYCYLATNKSGLTLGTHDLVDDHLGTIFFGLPYALSPGRSVWVTQTATISTETVNVATWTADTVEASAVATVVHGTLIFADGFESGNVSAW